MLASNVSSLRSRTRRLVHRTRGLTHGPITRLMSPGDLGGVVKPFVFLDYFDMTGHVGPAMADHPHSGIATHTTLLEGSIDYRDSTGKSGRLAPGSVEWMMAGGGVWHGGGAPFDGAPVRGYQLWVALPSALELAPSASRYVESSALVGDGPARALLGGYGSSTSPIAAPSPMAYLHVRLVDGETWTYRPARDHDVAWVAVNEGRLHVAGAALSREMGVFDEGNAPLELRAEGSTEFVLGSAAKHPHPLVCGSYSVHTSAETLRAGESGIARIARAMGPGGLRGFIEGRT